MLEAADDDLHDAYLAGGADAWHVIAYLLAALVRETNERKEKKKMVGSRKGIS